jgi:hypothetical protein
MSLSQNDDPQPLRRLSHEIIITLAVQRPTSHKRFQGYKLTGALAIACLPILAIVMVFTVSRRLLMLCWLYGAVVAGTCIFLAPKRERVVVCTTCKSIPSAFKVKTCTLEAILPHEAGFLHIIGPKCVILSTCHHGGGEPLCSLWTERALLLVLLLSLFGFPAPLYLLCGCQISYIGFGLVGRRLESAFNM